MSNADKLYDILSALPVFEGLGTDARTREAADLLDQAGVVVADYEYTAYMGGAPSGFVVDSNYSPHAADATHRRRVHVGPWERMPEGEKHDAGSFYYGDEEP